MLTAQFAFFLEPVVEETCTGFHDFEMLQRDVTRFRDCLKRTDVLTLGSGALAGVGYPIDRDFVSKKLGFS